MRYVALLACAFVSASVFASNPGQPLDCSDWVFLDPGLACVPLIAANCSSDFCGSPGGPDEPGSSRAADNEGNLYLVRRVLTGASCDQNQISGRVELVRLDPAGQEHVAAFLPDRDFTTPVGRCFPHDRAFPWRVYNSSGITGPLIGVLSFIPTTGSFVVSLTSWTDDGSIQPYDAQRWVAAISGFPTTFDVLQSFTPQPKAVSFRVPLMPEGLPAVDHFDTYTGPLAHPIDFTQARPLACDYPASPPRIGDYLTAADPLPDPEPGTGRYYVTATTYEGQTRYGRKTNGGHASGRDSSLLPACAP